MRIVFRLLFALLLLGLAETNAQEMESDLTIGQDLDIIAFIEPPQHFKDISSRLARMFVRELELVSEGRPLDIKFYSGTQAEFNSWIENENCRYTVSLEIIKRGWSVDHSFQVPFVFHIYRNNFKLGAVLKLHRQGIPQPVLLKKYNVKVGGPRVYQILANNPQDGGLMIPYSQRAIKETKAEEKFISRLSKDIYKTMERYGG
ncbi:MAG: hypothetical protein GY839_09810 [candidate division Zixibacteria bacterium]|nr:hypothetical protein [candidate division Zixibacteria bacterium]